MFPVRQQEGQLDIMLEMGGEYQGELIGVLKYNSEIFSQSVHPDIHHPFLA
jgi:hypothetical protein